MRTKAASILLFLLAVLGLGCSSSSNHPGRYAPISRGGGYGDFVLDTQTGAIFAPDRETPDDDGWKISRRAIPELYKRIAERKGPTLWE
jgi:hypothetical protein